MSAAFQAKPSVLWLMQAIICLQMVHRMQLATRRPGHKLKISSPPASMDKTMRIWSLALVALGAIVCNVVAHPLIGGNMNGKYVVASGDKVHVPFNDDYASKGHEYFDVWAPEIATHYGDAFWTSQGNTPLPQHIVERFKGKVMAITGYEQDQVYPTRLLKPHCTHPCHVISAKPHGC